MKPFLIVAAILLCGCSTTYVKVGAGYKLQESDIDWRDGSDNHPVSARVEVYKKQGALSYGVAHHSQWLQGRPFNDGLEYSKTEVFIDYTFSLGGNE
jgi:hypothetical protein